MKRALWILLAWFGLIFKGVAADNALQPVADVAATASKYKDKAVDFLILHGPALFGALVIMVIGFMAGSWVRKLVDVKLQKKSLEPPVRILIGRVIHIFIIGFSLTIALDTLGFKLTSLIAGISVAGVGIGFAMQGLLGNLFAGLLIIFTKPFRVGEYIEIVGVNGQVDAIELFSTVLIHGDKSRVIIPNKKIIGEILHNYGTIRQLDLSVGVAYGTNIPDTIALVRDILRENKRVLKDFTPGVGVTMLADSSISLSIKPWVSIQDFGAAGAEIYQELIQRFQSRKIEIPCPQREIRIVHSSNGAGTAKLGI